MSLQGYLARKKTLTPLGPPQGPRHGPTVGSWEAAVSYQRGAPVIPPGQPGLFKPAERERGGRERARAREKERGRDGKREREREGKGER